ncbi:amidase [Siccirubricoccus sp. G192]|uniref:amidase n=1 Tax=Siccirubricoccus sp. G192 TaxID=2849651 RepID=UPI001C2BCEB7|nr:amidase [Siccirubricoccus sp. G192]MBV1796599.1 amidase [Siccirubricoccus sp. G192]
MDGSQPSAYTPQGFRALTFHDAARRFAEGADTPRAYLERCLETIAAREPVVQAWVMLNETGAREAAEASTARWRSGRPLSPIDGMPIGIKDLLETRDMPTRMGCDAHRDNFPKRDNAGVWALRQAGAVVLGKTVTAELGGTQPGPTTNPFNAAHTPGGSSSGSAAAVGARMVPAAIGTQVGGSIIRPASYCGNVALKPTQGAINRGERQATSMSTHGVHAGCIEDMWQVAIEIARRAGGDPGRLGLFGPDVPPAAQRPVTLAVMETEGWSGLDAAARTAFEAVVEQLRAQGVTVLRRGDHAWIEAFERAIDGAQAMANAITAWENRWGIRNLVDQNPEGVSARAKAGLAAAEKLTPEDYRARLMQREEARLRHAALAPLVDALIAPASPGPAPAWGGDVPGQPLTARPTGDSVFNTPSSALGAPVVTAPLTAVRGLPMGIQVMGQPHGDARVAGFARWMLETLEPVVV